MSDKNKKNNEVSKKKMIGDSKAKLLAVRKAQAEEQAALKNDNFSIEQELNDMKTTLLVHEEQSGDNIEKTNVVPEEKIEDIKTAQIARGEITPILESVITKSIEDDSKNNKENKPKSSSKKTTKSKPLTEAQKQALKEKEKLRKAKERLKQKEKERLAKEKLKQKEKERLAKERLKQKEKEKLAKEKLKNQAIEKTKKEKLFKNELNEIHETKEIEPIVIEQKTIDDELKTLEVKNEQIKKNDNLPEFKSITNRFETTEVNETKSEDVENKFSIDNLQKLREKIMAQKQLERELMEREVAKSQQKDRTLMTKFNELEDLAKIEEKEKIEKIESLNEKIKDLNKDKKDLNEKLKEANNKLQKLFDLKYNDILVLSSTNLELSSLFIDEIQKVLDKQVINSSEDKNPGLVEEYLKQLNIERTKHNNEIASLEKELKQANLLNIAHKQVYANSEARNKNQIDSLSKQVSSLEKELEEAKNNNINASEITRLVKEIEEYKNKYLNTQKDLITSEEEFANYKLNSEAKNKEVVNKLNDEVNNLKKDLTLLQKENNMNRQSYENECNNFKKELEEKEAKIENVKQELEKTLTRIESYKQALLEEKNSHYQVEQKLFKDLDVKDQEIMRLNNELNKLAQDGQNQKLDSQINAIASLVNELESKSKEKSVSNYQMPPICPQVNPMLYYHQNDNIDAMKKEYEKELERRDNIIEALKKEKQAEIANLSNINVNKLSEQERYELNQKFDKLEGQVHDLTILLANMPKQINQVKEEVIKPLVKNDLEEYKNKLKAMMLVAYNYSDAMNLRDLLDKHRTMKTKLTNCYNNELNNLAIEAKYSRNEEEQKNISEKIDFLKNQYQIATKEMDLEYSRMYDILEVNQVKTSYGDVENNEDEKATSEVVKQVVETKDVKDSEKEVVSIEDKETNSSSIKTQNFNNTHFVGSFNTEYLSRLNNINRMRKILLDKLSVENDNYEKALEENKVLRKECENKSESIKSKIAEISNNFKEKKDFSKESENNYENEKSKLYFELQSRQEQYRRLQEDDLRKLDLRHKKVVDNINEQLALLDNEEKNIKEAYLLKLQKQQSQKNREEEMKRKLEEEKKTQEDMEEKRIIESKEEIKLRNFNNDGENETLVEKENEINNDEEIVDTVEEENQEIEKTQNDANVSTKEIALTKLYQKYSAAEREMVLKFRNVSDYKDLSINIRSLEHELEKCELEISEIEDNIRIGSSETKVLHAKLKDLRAKKESLNANIKYQKKQINKFVDDVRVKDYMALVAKLDEMEILLKQYQELRDK